MIITNALASRFRICKQRQHAEEQEGIKLLCLQRKTPSRLQNFREWFAQTSYLGYHFFPSLHSRVLLDLINIIPPKNNDR
jgi:hypothetical protein